MCMPACMTVYHVCAVPEDSTRFSETGVADDHKLQ